MVDNVLAIGIRDLKIKSRSLWYPVLITLSLIVYSIIITNHWQHVLRQGAVSGNITDQSFRILFVVLLVGVMIDSSTSISSEKETGVINWMVLQPVKHSDLIIGKFLAIFSAFLISAILCITVALIISLISGLYIFFSVLQQFISLLFSGFYFIGVGLLISSFTKNLKSSVGLVLIFVFTFIVFSALSLWLQLRPIPNSFDSYYVIALLITTAYRYVSFLLPISLIIGDVPFLSGHYIVICCLSMLQGGIGILLAGRILKNARSKQ